MVTPSCPYNTAVLHFLTSLQLMLPQYIHQLLVSGEFCHNHVYSIIKMQLMVPAINKNSVRLLLLVWAQGTVSKITSKCWTKSLHSRAASTFLISYSYGQHTWTAEAWTNVVRRPCNDTCHGLIPCIITICGNRLSTFNMTNIMCCLAAQQYPPAENWHLYQSCHWHIPS